MIKLGMLKGGLPYDSQVPSVYKSLYEDLDYTKLFGAILCFFFFLNKAVIFTF